MTHSARIVKAGRSAQVEPRIVAAASNVICEALEGRQLMSVTIDLSAGVLVMTADPATPSRMFVGLSHDGSELNASINGQHQHFALNAVQAIDITGSNESDLIRLSAHLKIGAQVSGGSGNDTIIGGAGDDTITAGSGNDFIRGRKGDDSIIGGTGHDTLMGGMGDDTIDGSRGDDLINGQEGKNHIIRSANDKVRSRRRDVVSEVSTQVAGAQGSGTSSQSTGSSDSQSSTPVHTSSDGLAPVISFIESSGMAGHAVHVNALSSTITVGDQLSTTYNWNFGDPNGQFNTLVGWNAAHLYMQPGVYTVTLSMTDSKGDTASASAKVTISPDTRQKIYVSNSGNDNNTGASPSQAVATVARASELLGNNSEMLIHAGQTFAIPDSINVSGSNILITSYGGSADPLLRKTNGTGTYILHLDPTCDNVLIENITFDSIYTIAGSGLQKVAANGISAGGRDIAVVGCQFYNLTDAINTNADPVGVLVQECYFGPQIRGYCIWGEGTDQVYIGNTMTNSTQEHLIRTDNTGVTRLLIEDNNLSRPTQDKGSIELRIATWFYVAGNSINGGTLRMGLGNNSPTDWGVVEGNETWNIWLNIRPGVQHVAYRDNVMNWDQGSALILETKYGSANREIDDIRIDHNTVISDSNSSRFLLLDGPAQDISVTNNLVVAPNLVWAGEQAGGVVVDASNLSSFTSISNNIWPQIPSGSQIAGDNYLWPVSGDPADGYMSNAQWAKLPQVHGEQYENVDLSGDVYGVSLNGVTAGAVPGIFNPQSWANAAKGSATPPTY